MKILKKAITLNVGLVLLGTGVFAQDLNTAKKAIDAEQYQQAKSLLKALVAKDAKKGDNYYNLGLVYLKTGYIDSARATFNAGLLADPKSAYNYAGLGEADLIQSNEASANTNFENAIGLAKKDYRTYLAIGRAFLAQNKPEDVKSTPNFEKAIANLNIADELDKNDKDADVFVALGDAYALQSKNSEALGPYFRVEDIDPTNRRAKVQTGKMYKQSRAFSEAESELLSVVEADPNYGPAYRELGELYLQWSDFGADKEKAAKAIENYKKYIDLTDESLESNIRFAQFLFYAKDFVELEKVASQLNVSEGDIYGTAVARMKGWAAYENKNYTQALTYLNELFAKTSDKSKILANDYLYLGKSQMQNGDKENGLLNIIEATKLDSTNADAIAEIAGNLMKDKEYGKSADAYELAVQYNPNGKGSLYNYYYVGVTRFYEAYFAQRDKLEMNVEGLKRADEILGRLEVMSPDLAMAPFYRARINGYLDDKTTPQGLSVPHYEKFTTLVKPEEIEANKTNLTEAYDILGEWYAKIDKEKAIEYFTKSVATDSTATYAPAKLKELTAAPAKGKGQK